MACIWKEVVIEAPAEAAWSAVRDFGGVHRRLVPGVLADARLDGANARVVTFANGMVVREALVDLDDERRRLAYTVVEGGRTSHHNASMQVQPDGPHRCRIVWITDLLPDEMAPSIAALVEQGAAAMQRALDRRA